MIGDMRVYAKFEPTQYDINYHLNGGENSQTNISTYTIESDKIILENPNKTNFGFAGWYTDSEFTKQITEIVKQIQQMKDKLDTIQEKMNKYYDVIIISNNDTFKLVGYMDTGNRLRDNIFLKPVISSLLSHDILWNI